MRPVSAALWLGILLLLTQVARGENVRDSFGGAGQFAAYHEAADREMSGIIENLVGGATPPKRALAPMPPPSAARAEIRSRPAPAVTLHPDWEISLNAIAAYAQRFWNGRTVDLQLVFSRLERIRPEQERILEEEGVPPRCAAVVLVESGANPQALSPKSARGLWQILPETARRYGLVVGPDQTDLQSRA